MISTRQLARSLINQSTHLRSASKSSSFIPTSTLSIFPRLYSPSNHFSSSSLSQSKSDAEKKETENQKAGEAIGATEGGEGEKVDSSKFNEQLKEKDAKIKELQVSKST